MSEPETVGRSIGREEILSGTLEAQLAKEIGRARIMPVAERLKIKRQMIAEVPPGEDVWLFGYGSLIWTPGFNFLERRIGQVHGWRRNFSFWSTSGRGTPETPGMMLALEPGGSCAGVAFRIARDRAVEELRSVFMRELMTGSYFTRWMNVRGDGGAVRAIGFVVNKDHRNYAGILPPETVGRYIATGKGRLGACSDYLVNTVRHLEALGIRDRTLTRLMDIVEVHRPGIPQG